MNEQCFDIIILGAGISGLLLGSQLSQKHSVLIIEKGNSLPNNKYWLTNKKCVEKNLELFDCIDSQYDHMDFRAYDSESYRCFGEYLLWDTNRLIQRLEEIILKNVGIILSNRTFYSYRDFKDYIIVYANDKRYSGKLIIDCMGYSSPIIYAKSLIRIIGYYVLYGKVLKLKSQVDPTGLSNIVISSRPKYLEIFPKQNDEAYVVLIAPEKSLQSSTSLRNEFKFITEESEYSRYFYKSEENGDQLGGLIPVGNLKTNSLNRILLFGEAGQMNPSATATCLTQLLYSYKEICAQLSDRIKYNELDDRNLSISNPYFTERNRKFHIHLFNNILNWNSDDFRKLVLQMAKMDKKLVNEIIFGEVSADSFYNVKSILSLIRSKNYFVLNPILKSLWC